MAEPIRAYQTRICRRAIGAAIVTALLFIIAGWAAVGKGLLLGTLFSITNFLLLGQFLPAVIIADGRQRRLLTAVSLIVRYLLLAIPLVAAVKLRQFHLAATVIGIFSIQLTILADIPLKRFSVR